MNKADVELLEQPTLTDKEESRGLNQGIAATRAARPTGANGAVQLDYLPLAALAVLFVSVLPWTSLSF